MPNQQLLDYIKLELQKGIGQEQIETSLKASGWQAQDIVEGFGAANTPESVSIQAPSSGNPSKKMWLVLGGFLIVAPFIGAGAFLASQALFKAEKTANISYKDSTPIPTTVPLKIATSTAQAVQPTESENPELIFADKLSSCTKYKITFKHPLTRDMLEKEILGMVNGKCGYVEQTPGNGKMECKYSESEFKTMSQYYKDIYAAMAQSKSFSASINTEGNREKNIYKIDGKVVEDPLQDAMNRGVCDISVPKNN